MTQLFKFLLVIFISSLFLAPASARLIEFDLSGSERRVDGDGEELPTRRVEGNLYYDIELGQMVAGVLNISGHRFVYDEASGVGASYLIGNAWDYGMWIDFEVTFRSTSEPGSSVFWDRNQYEFWVPDEFIPCNIDSRIPCGNPHMEERIWDYLVERESLPDAYPVYQDSYYANGDRGTMWVIPDAYRYIDEVPDFKVPEPLPALLMLLMLTTLTRLRVRR
ncbi:hypothetical protein ACFSJ3_07495 [Corallincola platygyrae]|uniref:PEP-CTERM sorting domain-containing protein n=1 Tax=Corallincola platygyrae TaxID=1193278 RepID=A0ABW4XKR4_9GAMM